MTQILKQTRKNIKPLKLKSSETRVADQKVLTKTTMDQKMKVVQRKRLKVWNCIKYIFPGWLMSTKSSFYRQSRRRNRWRDRDKFNCSSSNYLPYHPKQFRSQWMCPQNDEDANETWAGNWTVSHDFGLLYSTKDVWEILRTSCPSICLI